MKARQPSRADGDEAGHVIVWHMYQGAMLAHWQHCDNSFFLYWMSAREYISARAWIKAMEKPPDECDADAQGCVLVRDSHSEVRVVNRHLVCESRTFKYWLSLPGLPGAISD